MNFGKYLGLFGISTFKFMFAPLGGRPIGLNFYETYLSCVAGAIASAVVFYFLSEYFIIRSIKKQRRKIQEAIDKNLPPPYKKRFTFTNKLIVRIKQRFGIYGITFLGPFILSIPIGAIVCAKFYGKDKRTFPFITFGILLNGFLMTSIAYLF